VAIAPTTLVPETVDELLDRDWLVTHLDFAEDDEIVRVERTDSTKTRAEKLRFAVTVRRPSGLSVSYYCAKAHLDGTPSTGVISEARFYRDLAPRIPVRVPRTPYVAIDGTEGAIIVMEDVVASRGLFMNPHRPFPVDVAYESLSQLARLHGSTWGFESVGDIEWLSAGGAILRGFSSPDTLQALLDDGRADGFAPEVRSGANLAAALQIQADRPVTCVLHGDTHTGNWYLDADGRPCLFDWETIQRGNWSQDVAYHLGTVLSIDDRRAHERQLLLHYLDELAANGGPEIDFQEGWELYRRSFAYGYLLWVITMIRGRDEVLAHMPRLAAAIGDHDMYRLLGVV
jgi:hypothetical protein